MKYDIEQRVFMVKKFNELNHISLIQRDFRKEYPKEDTPSHSVVKNVVSNFEKYGSVAYVTQAIKNQSQKGEFVK